jgi:hypothetical protein
MARCKSAAVDAHVDEHHDQPLQDGSADPRLSRYDVRQTRERYARMCFVAPGCVLARDVIAADSSTRAMDGRFDEARCIGDDSTKAFSMPETCESHSMSGERAFYGDFG